MTVNIMKQFCVYMMASKKHGTIYIGVTSDLSRRAYEHKSAVVEGFTKKYGVHKLVWYEPFDDAENAIKREKRLKKYPRQWKMNLIEAVNPDWRDLYGELFV